MLGVHLQAGDTFTILKLGYVCFEVDAEVLAQGVIVGKDLTIPVQMLICLR